MYSFAYGESETWKIWPNHLSLSEFTSGRSTIIIYQIFRYFFDSVRDKVAAMKTNILDQKSNLLCTVNELWKALNDYQTSIEVGDEFVRLSSILTILLLLFWRYFSNKFCPIDRLLVHEFHIFWHCEIFYPNVTTFLKICTGYLLVSE